jgi:hypothetical protein
MSESQFLYINTRFRPTPYADLHCGHVWVAYHNWAWARNGGGKFVMIVDDIMYNLPHLSDQSLPLQKAVDRYVEDLDWLGIGPDEVVFSTTNADAHAEAAKTLGLHRIGMHDAPKSLNVTTVGCEAIEFGYHPWLVMTRVVDDHLANITGFWRGMDLVGEMYLYDFIGRSLGWRPPGQGYLPVVRREANPSKESKGNNEGISVRQLREAGYHPDSVVETIRECGDRSYLAGLKDCVIPLGVLELEEIKYLPLEHTGSRAYTNPKYPWSDDVSGYWSRFDDAKSAKRRSWAGVNGNITAVPEDTGINTRDDTPWTLTASTG